MRKPAAPKGPKKVKKRNPWSEDESKSDSELENSELVIPRENKSQRASGEAASPPAPPQRPASRLPLSGM